ncbi:MAG: DUF2188 domain-containing protein [Armatimonadota bacterium]
MAKKDYHAVPDGDRWACLGEGNKRASSMHDTQKDAWAAAMEMAKKSGTVAIKHGKDGTIKEQRNYG